MNAITALTKEMIKFHTVNPDDEPDATSMQTNTIMDKAHERRDTPTLRFIIAPPRN